MKDGDDTAEPIRDRKRLSGLTRKRCDSPNHIEIYGGGNNKTSRLITYQVTKVTECNDPCLLRHTAGCSFYQGENVILALAKSSLIDLDGYVYANAA